MAFAWLGSKASAAIVISFPGDRKVQLFLAGRRVPVLRENENDGNNIVATATEHHQRSSYGVNRNERGDLELPRVIPATGGS